MYESVFNDLEREQAAAREVEVEYDCGFSDALLFRSPRATNPFYMAGWGDSKRKQAQKDVEIIRLRANAIADRQYRKELKRRYAGQTEF